MRRCILGAVAAILLTAPLGAQTPGSETDRLLLAAGSSTELRAALLEHAARVEGTDRVAAAESYTQAGSSYYRASHHDSAIVCLKKAVDLEGGHAARLALADALLARAAPEDARQAIELLETSRASLLLDTEPLQNAYQSRLAWAQSMAGHPDSAAALFLPLEGRLSRDPLWRRRMGLAHANGADLRKAITLLLPCAIRSRKYDGEVMAKVEQVSERLRVNRLTTEIDRGIAAHDQADSRALVLMNAERGQFPARDGFPLSGVVVRPAKPARHRAAVVLMAPGDSIADYDSLCVALHRARFTPLLLEIRGSGFSVAPPCPSAECWEGREERVHWFTARDVVDAVRAFAPAANVDTSKILLCGVGPTASMAAEAAEIDPRAFALLLVSPRPAPVERGPMLARLARTQIPTYFLSGPEDFDDARVTEALYQAGPRGASRVAEARLVGRGPRQFYYDPALRERFTRWLEETAKHAGKRRPRPPAPRRG